MKKRNICTLTALMIGVLVMGCKDEFDEEKFLRKQAELNRAAKRDQAKRDSAEVNFYVQAEVQSYIDALNAAGDLLAVTFLMRENGNPVSDVTVTLTTGTADQPSNGRAKEVLTGQTDAAGIVTFENVVIGKGTVLFSKPGFLTTTAIVDFGTPDPPGQVQTVTSNGVTVVRYVPPVKRLESGAVNMFSTSAGGGHTATIEGVVTIETDVTNLEPEIPEGIVIRANLSALSPGGVPSFMSAFAFADESGLGVATISADGSYSMTVPATASGIPISFIVPQITGPRRTAVNGYDNGTGVAVPLPNGPAFRDVPTSWGPQIGILVPGIPLVIGAKLEFSAPPASGTGLTFDLTPVPRSLPAGASYLSTNGNGNDGFAVRIANRGNFGASFNRPQVQISGGGGSGAQAKALLSSFISALNVTNVGAGYAGPVTLTIRGQRVDGGPDDNIISANIATLNGALPSVIDLQNVDVIGFGWDNDPITMQDVHNSLSLFVSAPPPGGTQAVVTPTFISQLQGIVIDQVQTGSGYTSAPTITIVHPDPGVTPAAVEVLDLQVFWNISPNNSGATDYPLLPEDLTIHFPQTKFEDPRTGSVVDGITHHGIEELSDEDILDMLTISNGDVVMKNPGLVMRTNNPWGAMPSISVNPRETTQAAATFEIGDINETTGAITGTPTFNNIGGTGYPLRRTVTIVPTIEGAPGTGASIQLTESFNGASGEWEWFGTSQIVANGSGYLRNLNRKTSQAGSFPGPINVQSGKTYRVNFTYGTGSHQVPIN